MTEAAIHVGDIAECASCKQRKPIKVVKRQMCERCYNKCLIAERPVTECPQCGKVTKAHAKGLCKRCYERKARQLGQRAALGGTIERVKRHIAQLLEQETFLVQRLEEVRKDIGSIRTLLTGVDE